jgi:hypothetical protein
MSHKKTADDNPQFNFCGYPLNLLSESGFQKTSCVFSGHAPSGKVLALLLLAADGKNANRLIRSPSKGMERLPEVGAESTAFLKKS